VIFLSDFSFVRIFLRNYRVTMTTTLDTSCSENTMVCQQGEGFCMHVFSSYNLLHPLYLGVESHVTARCQGLFPPSQWQKGKSPGNEVGGKFHVYYLLLHSMGISKHAIERRLDCLILMQFVIVIRFMFRLGLYWISR
jgi:hypothetical protein